MLRFLPVLPVLVVLPQLLLAIPPQISPFIHIDQFGYLPDARKVAVIADPQAGFNATQFFQPGTTYEVRHWTTDAVVFTGAPTIWNAGATHQQSGDKGWWFDFSAVTQPGSYYVYDVQKQVGSHQFEIGPDVYRAVLRTALRMYFYQRINFARQVPYADARWADGASYEGPNQDRAARSRYAKTDASTARDVHGGWMDAGDPNKYTTFTEPVVLMLLQAYQANPGVFTDDNNIPESGNGLPDLLDEVKWELEWLRRMQDATGTGGLLLKVGVDNFNDASPPSQDTRPRYYVPECTSSTLAGAAMFAMAGLVYRDIPAWKTFGDDLIARAAQAWQRGKSQSQNFTVFQETCDDQNITSGDADRGAQEQLESAFMAAVYLYAATGDATYRSYVESAYTQVRPFKETWWGPYRQPTGAALLYYAGLPTADGAVASAIVAQKAGMNYAFSIDTYQAGTDLYRAFLEDWAHHWGSNQVRATAGNLNLDFVQFGINATSHDSYREVGLSYLHWLHGVNPLGMVMLTNMYEVGGDACANEMYHTWFKDGSVWDHALTSPKGPAPGYVTGGPNASFSGTGANLSPPNNQPPQKSYKDWNTGWPENSWEVTEPAIYYQAAYVLLLSRLMAPGETTAIGPVRSPALALYPNPATGQVSIEGLAPGRAVVCLRDLRGASLWTQALRVDGGAVVCDLPRVPAGVYLLEARSQQGVQYARLVIE
ncbi:MAG: hypothetical protein OHK0039_07320 [Bacteroidia bacterium]